MTDHVIFDNCEAQVRPTDRVDTKRGSIHVELESHLFKIQFNMSVSLVHKGQK